MKIKMMEFICFEDMRTNTVNFVIELIAEDGVRYNLSNDGLQVIREMEERVIIAKIDRRAISENLAFPVGRDVMDYLESQYAKYMFKGPRGVEFII